MSSPSTIDEVVELLLEDLDEDATSALRALKEDELSDQHFGFALYVRNTWLYPTPRLSDWHWWMHVDQVSATIVRRAREMNGCTLQGG